MKPIGPCDYRGEMSKTTQNMEGRTMTIRNLSEVELELVAGGTKQDYWAGTGASQKPGAVNTDFSNYGDMHQNPDPDDPTSVVG